MPLCFAYGSNMDRAAMATRCPRAKVVGLGRLERHRLAIMREGYATVVRDPHRSVHGVVWDIPFADIPALDRYEDVASGLYVKRQQAIATARGAKRALVYFGANAGPGVPLAGYLEGVLQAARDVGLPERALTDIASLRTGSRVAGPVAAVKPTRATPLDPPQPASRPGWKWSP